MRNILKLLLAVVLLAGCSEEPFYVAEIGHAGSTTGYHSIKFLSLKDVLGGGGGFAYGAVNGYPGASADIGGMGVPKHIEGYWAKYKEKSGLAPFYKISAPIDSELAEKKIRTLQNYYKNYSTYGVMQVLVDSERVRVLYSLSCIDRYDDCTPKQNADPNHWVQRSPRDVTDVVVLFDGTGEYSPIPFSDSPYDEPRFYPSNDKTPSQEAK